jgi:hypothetical protein
MAIRLRRSEFMKDFFRSQRKEQQEHDRLLKSPTTRHNSR